MKTKYPVHITMFGVVISDGDVKLPLIFLHGLRLNTEAYIKYLEELVPPWVAAGRPYVWQQNSAPYHICQRIQCWL